MSEEVYRPGLEGVIAGETGIGSVEQGGLYYRGYAIQELAEQSSFEETAYLVLQGELPTAAQLKRFKSDLDEYRTLPEAVIEILRQIPDSASAMDVLRTALSASGHFGPPDQDEPASWHQGTLFLTAQIASIIAARQRLLRGDDPVAPKPGLDHAAQTLYMLHGKDPSAVEAELLDLTLILYMEHEYNASTFAARVCASTLSDLTSCVVGAIGTLKGPLHGGANEAAIHMLSQFDTAEQAREWTLRAIRDKEKIMGFGHRVYKHGDHRARILEQRMRVLASELGEEHQVAVYDAVRTTMEQEKNILPNVDYPCGLTYHLLKLPIDIYTPLFVASRVVGWSAHAIEQHFNNRIIRPRSKYVGAAKRPYRPVSERG